MPDLPISDSSGMPEAQERQLPEIDFSQGVLNALPAHIALLDRDGRIEIVNRAWREFGGALRADKFGVGSSYLAACEKARGEGAAEAGRMSAGIRAVLRGELPRFELEYPCHSPTQLSWFRASVIPVVVENRRFALVAHTDITERVRAQQALEKAEHEPHSGRRSAAA